MDSLRFGNLPVLQTTEWVIYNKDSAEDQKSFICVAGLNKEEKYLL